MADVIEVRPKRLTPELAAAVAAKGTIEGNRVLEWWGTQAADLQAKFATSVRISMANGETLQQATTRIVGGTVNGVEVAGIMKKSRAQASALVATSMNHATNQARLATYRKNTKLIKAIQQVSTLDNRTSEVCIAYSGLMWDAATLEPIDHELPFNGGPPRHWNCRSTIIPITRSFRELGVDIDEVPRGQRASMDGAVPADITFDEWLRGKDTDFQDNLLGTRKAELWRDNKMTLQQLVDFRGEPVPVGQLEQLLQRKPAVVVRDVELEAPFKTLYPKDLGAAAMDASVDAAARKAYSAYVESWKPLAADRELKGAVQEYMDDEAGINAVLRGKTDHMFQSIYENSIRRIQAMMGDMPALTADTLAYRGTANTRGTYTNLVPGDSFQVQGFFSTSTSPMTARNFLGEAKEGSLPVVFEIVLPKGSTRVLRGFNRDEKELLLDHNTHYMVTSTRTETVPDSRGTPRQVRVLRLVYRGQ